MEKAPNLIRLVNDPSIIAFGPITLSSGLRPRRIVLRKLPGQFVTHVEYVHLDVRRETLPPTDDFSGGEFDVVHVTHDEFEHGHYFTFNNVNRVTEEKAFNDALDNMRKRK
jgi:hypothetical protein